MELTHSGFSCPLPASLEAKEHLKPVVPKDQDSGGCDHWAKRRTLFKESKQWSSAGGSSITSDITEESGTSHGGRLTGCGTVMNDQFH